MMCYEQGGPTYERILARRVSGLSVVWNMPQIHASPQSNRLHMIIVC